MAEIIKPPVKNLHYGTATDKDGGVTMPTNPGNVRDCKVLYDKLEKEVRKIQAGGKASGYELEMSYDQDNDGNPQDSILAIETTPYPNYKIVKIFLPDNIHQANWALTFLEKFATVQINDFVAGMYQQAVQLRRRLMGKS